MTDQEERDGLKAFMARQDRLDEQKAASKFGPFVPASQWCTPYTGEDVKPGAASMLERYGFF
jgi:hypothetical protein